MFPLSFIFSHHGLILFCDWFIHSVTDWVTHSVTLTSPWLFSLAGIHFMRRVFLFSTSKPYSKLSYNKLFSFCVFVTISDWDCLLFFFNTFHCLYVWKNVFSSRDINLHTTVSLSFSIVNWWQSSENDKEYVDLKAERKKIRFLIDWFSWLGLVTCMSTLWICEFSNACLLNKCAALHGQAIMSPVLNIWFTFDTLCLMVFSVQWNSLS